MLEASTYCRLAVMVDEVLQGGEDLVEGPGFPLLRLRVLERVSLAFLVHDAVVHDLGLVPHREGVGVVRVSALSDQEVAVGQAVRRPVIGQRAGDDLRGYGGVAQLRLLSIVSCV